MPQPERAFAHTLAVKAGDDLSALEALLDRGGISDAIIGFHAQQAVEKALKAVLVAGGWELRRTHDIRFLLDELESTGIELPPRLAEADWLTPWATELRYDDFADDPLDRQLALATAQAAVALAAGHG